MDLNNIEVLLVEDNMDDAELTTRELTKNRLANNLFHVSDGKMALDFIFGRGAFQNIRMPGMPLKLILLDIQMPKINGIEVLRVIKSDEYAKTTPVVMLTSSREDPDIKQCYEAGANSYIVKPVSFVGFTEAIKSVGLYWLLINQPPVKM